MEQQRDAPFSYPDVGASRHETLPRGYNVDTYRIQLGVGSDTFAAARKAVQGWEMFDRRWVRVFPAAVEIRAESTIAVVARHFRFYSINLAGSCTWSILKEL